MLTMGLIKLVSLVAVAASSALTGAAHNDPSAVHLTQTDVANHSIFGDLTWGNSGSGSLLGDLTWGNSGSGSPLDDLTCCN